MSRYLPGAILAIFGAGAYAIGCMLYLAYRRERDPACKSKPLIVYGIAMMILGIIALGGGLYALEMTEIHVLSH
jgi:hypothetical protein